jgi:SAM-dependent methyltransferase
MDRRLHPAGRARKAMGMQRSYGRRLEPLVKPTESAGRRVFKAIAAKSRKLYASTARDYRVADDSNYDHESHAYFRNELSKLTVAIPQGGAALDLGCGTGRYFHCLKGMQRIVGVDVSEEMLAFARDPSMGSEVEATDIRLICDDIHSVGFPDASFDFVYSIGVLGLCSPLTIELCDKIYSWLKPGGSMYLFVMDAVTLRESSWKRDLAIRLYPVLPGFMKTRVFLRVQDCSVTNEELRLVMEKSHFATSRVISSRDLDPEGKIWRRSFFTVSATRVG